MGCIGMSIDDFDRCTPTEISDIYGAWMKGREAIERQQWERDRWVATCLLQPYSKKALKPRDLAVFPWERIVRHTPRPELSAEERERRFELARSRYGLK